MIGLGGVGVEFARPAGALTVLQGLDLTIHRGDFTCILGPSGSGKTTILNLIAGFIRPTHGSVVVEGRESPSPGRDRGYVFQHHGLFPWKSIAQNIEFGLLIRGVPRSERRAQVHRIAGAVGLGDFLDDRPDQLSGGMQQRAGLARVLVNEPEILLMDEPFSSLDAMTAQQMREFLARLLAPAPKTVVFVTHDVDEALFLADRVILLSERPGRVVLDERVQLARPRSEDIVGEKSYLQLRSLIYSHLFGRENAPASDSDNALRPSTAKD